MKNTRNTKPFLKYVGFILLLSSLSFLGCRTLPTEETVSKDLTPIEIKQLAQEEIDNGSKRNALAYYEILLNRYGSDMSVRTAAEFEIAHIYIKQKKWAVADDMLKNILTRYESAGGAGLPPKYLVLARNDYAKTQAYFEKKERKTKKEVKIKNEETLKPEIENELKPEQEDEPKAETETVNEEAQE